MIGVLKDASDANVSELTIDMESATSAKGRVASVRAGKLLGAYVRELSGGRLNAVHSAWEAVLRAAS